MVSVFQGTPQFLKAAEGGLVAEMSAKKSKSHAAAGYVHVLLPNDLDVIASLLQLSKDGSTALHLAARNGHTAAMTLLLEKGADIAIKDFVSKTNTTKTKIVNNLS